MTLQSEIGKENWREHQKLLFRLQRRIYKASTQNDISKVKSLQTLLCNSYSARILAVRQVTQLNTGKKTASIDGKNSLNNTERETLVNQLRNWKRWKHDELKHIPIPKKDGKIRMLKVPNIKDRAYQCLLKYALEPAHEPTFHKYSYGFRTGRSTWDAQKILFINLNSKVNGHSKRILEIDITKCFDTISHKTITDRLISNKRIKIGISRLLKIGINPEFPEQGTPQGGVISPLLANIALNGIESIDNNITCVRYADDMVYILKPKQDAKQLLVKIDNFLAEKGMKLNEKKTLLTEATKGFDFLGWNFLVKKNNKFICQPSKDNIEKLKKKVKNLVKKSNYGQNRIVKELSAIIRGWRKYHQYCDMSKNSLYHLTYWTWKQLNKAKNSNRYKTNNLIKIAFPTVQWQVNKHINVKENLSPYNGDILYWSERNSKLYDGLTSKTLKRQDHYCGYCGLKLIGDDIVELHHKDSNHKNNKHNNLIALHKSCHKIVTSTIRKGLKPNFIGSVVQ